MDDIDRAACWAPVSRRWRYVRAGDITVGRYGALIPILGVRLRPSGLTITYPDGDGVPQDVRDVDPDETVEVLVPAIERDGLVLLSESMNAYAVEEVVEVPA